MHLRRRRAGERTGGSVGWARARPPGRRGVRRSPGCPRRSGRRPSGSGSCPRASRPPRWRRRCRGGADAISVSVNGRPERFSTSQGRIDQLDHSLVADHQFHAASVEGGARYGAARSSPLACRETIRGSGEWPTAYPRRRRAHRRIRAQAQLQGGGAEPAARGLHLQLHRPHDHRHHRPGDKDRPEDHRRAAGPSGRALFRAALHAPRHPDRAAGRALQPGVDHHRLAGGLVGVHRPVRLGAELRAARRAAVRRRASARPAARPRRTR